MSAHTPTHTATNTNLKMKEDCELVQALSKCAAEERNELPCIRRVSKSCPCSRLVGLRCYPTNGRKWTQPKAINPWEIVCNQGLCMHHKWTTPLLEQRIFCSSENQTNEQMQWMPTNNCWRKEWIVTIRIFLCAERNIIIVTIWEQMAVYSQQDYSRCNLGADGNTLPNAKALFARWHKVHCEEEERRIRESTFSDMELEATTVDTTYTPPIVGHPIQHIE